MISPACSGSLAATGWRSSPAVNPGPDEIDLRSIWRAMAAGIDEGTGRRPFKTYHPTKDGDAARSGYRR